MTKTTIHISSSSLNDPALPLQMTINNSLQHTRSASQEIPRLKIHSRLYKIRPTAMYVSVLPPMYV
jgi:hypothetical protein